MTETQILERSQALAPKIRLRDVWFQLRRLENKELVYCLTQKPVTGKVYFLTEKGRAEVASGYGKSVQELPDKVDWNRYVLVVRAKVRRLVLSELNRPSWQGKQGKTATEIRKHLLDKAQLCLGSILRALNDLVRLRLARRVTSENGKAYRRYVLTPMGRKIAGEIQR